MKHLKNLLVLILSLQLINISFLSAQESIHPYNLKFDHRENLDLIYSYNSNLKPAINKFIIDNKIDLNQLPKFQIIKIDQNTYELKDRNETIKVAYLKDDQIKIYFNKKTFTIITKNNNFSDWIKNFDNSTSQTVTQFIFSLFINEAHAISYAILMGVAVVLTALGIKYLGSTMPFDNAVSKAKASCESLKDEASEKDEVKLNINLTILNKAYADKCTKTPSKKECVSASELIECLNGFLKSKTQSNTDQREKKSSDAGDTSGAGSQTSMAR